MSSENCSKTTRKKGSKGPKTLPEAPPEKTEIANKPVSRKLQVNHLEKMNNRNKSKSENQRTYTHSIAKETSTRDVGYPYVLSKTYEKSTKTYWRPFLLRNSSVEAPYFLKPVFSYAVLWVRIWVRGFRT